MLVTEWAISLIDDLLFVYDSYLSVVIQDDKGVTGFQDTSFSVLSDKVQ